MKGLFLFSIVGIFFLQGGFTTVPPNYCELSGQVYVVRIPTQADYRVSKVDQDAPCDFRIIEERQVGFEKEAGHWFFTSSRAAADFTVYWEKEARFADFTLSITAFEDEVGCQP